MGVELDIESNSTTAQSDVDKFTASVNRAAKAVEDLGKSSEKLPKNLKGSTEASKRNLEELAKRVAAQQKLANKLNSAKQVQVVQKQKTPPPRSLPFGIKFSQSKDSSELRKQILALRKDSGNNSVKIVQTKDVAKTLAKSSAARQNLGGIGGVDTKALEQRYEKALSATDAFSAGLKNKLTGAKKSTDSAADGIAGSIEKITTALAAGAAVFGAITFVDSIVSLENRIKSITKDTEGYNVAMSKTQRIAAATGESLGAVAGLYSRISISAKSLGATQAQVGDVTSTIIKGLQLGGASTQEAQSAAMQLGQALASGTLQGDELRSVMENSAFFADSLAKSLGVGVGELKTMGAEGRLSTEAVFKAILNSSKEINEQYGKMGRTFANVFTNFGTGFQILFQKLNNFTGFTNLLNGLFKVSQMFVKFAMDVDYHLLMLTAKVNMMIAGISSAFYNTFYQLGAMASAFFKKIGDGLSGLKLPEIDLKKYFINFDTVSKAISDFVTKAERGFFWLYDKVIGHSWFPDLINGVIDWSAKLANAPLSFITGFVTKAGEAFKSLWESSANYFGKIVEGFKELRGSFSSGIKIDGENSKELKGREDFDQKRLSKGDFISVGMPLPKQGDDWWENKTLRNSLDLFVKATTNTVPALLTLAIGFAAVGPMLFSFTTTLIGAASLLGLALAALTAQILSPMLPRKIEEPKAFNAPFNETINRRPEWESSPVGSMIKDLTINFTMLEKAHARSVLGFTAALLVLAKFVPMFRVAALAWVGLQATLIGLSSYFGAVETSIRKNAEDSQPKPSKVVFTKMSLNSPSGDIQQATGNSLSENLKDFTYKIQAFMSSNLKTILVLSFAAGLLVALVPAVKGLYLAWVGLNLAFAGLLTYFKVKDYSKASDVKQPDVTRASFVKYDSVSIGNTREVAEGIGKEINNGFGSRIKQFAAVLAIGVGTSVIAATGGAALVAQLAGLATAVGLLIVGLKAYGEQIDSFGAIGESLREDMRRPNPSKLGRAGIKIRDYATEKYLILSQKPWYQTIVKKLDKAFVATEQSAFGQSIRQLFGMKATNASTYGGVTRDTEAFVGMGPQKGLAERSFGHDAFQLIPKDFQDVVVMSMTLGVLTALTMAFSGGSWIATAIATLAATFGSAIVGAFNASIPGIALTISGLMSLIAPSSMIGKMFPIASTMYLVLQRKLMDPEAAAKAMKDAITSLLKYLNAGIKMVFGAGIFGDSLKATMILILKLSLMFKSFREGIVSALSSTLTSGAALANNMINRSKANSAKRDFENTEAKIASKQRLQEHLTTQRSEAGAAFSKHEQAFAANSRLNYQDPDVLRANWRNAGLVGRANIEAQMNPAQRAAFGGMILNDSSMRNFDSQITRTAASLERLAIQAAALKEKQSVYSKAVSDASERFRTGVMNTASNVGFVAGAFGGQRVGAAVTEKYGLEGGTAMLVQTGGGIIGGGIGAAIAGAGISLVSNLLARLLPLLTPIVGWLAMNPVTAAILAVTAVIAAATLLWKELPSDIGTAIASAIEDPTPIIDALKSAWNWVADGLMKIAAYILDKYFSFMEGVITLPSKIAEALSKRLFPWYEKAKETDSNWAAFGKRVLNPSLLARDFIEAIKKSEFAQNARANIDDALGRSKKKAKADVAAVDTWDPMSSGAWESRLAAQSDPKTQELVSKLQTMQDPAAVVKEVGYNDQQTPAAKAVNTSFSGETDSKDPEVQKLAQRLKEDKKLIEQYKREVKEWESLGWDLNSAKALAATTYAESGFKHDAYVSKDGPDGMPSGGIVQFHGPRKKALEAKYGMDVKYIPSFEQKAYFTEENVGNIRKKLQGKSPEESLAILTRDNIRPVNTDQKIVQRTEFMGVFEDAVSETTLTMAEVGDKLINLKKRISEAIKAGEFEKAVSTGDYSKVGNLIPTSISAMFQLGEKKITEALKARSEAKQEEQRDQENAKKAAEKEAAWLYGMNKASDRLGMALEHKRAVKEDYTVRLNDIGTQQGQVDLVNESLASMTDFRFRDFEEMMSESGQRIIDAITLRENASYKVKAALENGDEITKGRAGAAYNQSTRSVSLAIRSHKDEMAAAREEAYSNKYMYDSTFQKSAKEAGANFAISFQNSFQSGLEQVLNGDITPKTFFKNLGKSLVKSYLATFANGLTSAVFKNTSLGEASASLGSNVFTAGATLGYDKKTTAWDRVPTNGGLDELAKATITDPVPVTVVAGAPIAAANNVSNAVTTGADVAPAAVQTAIQVISPPQRPVETKLDQTVVVQTPGPQPQQTQNTADTGGIMSAIANLFSAIGSGFGSMVSGISNMFSSFASIFSSNSGGGGGAGGNSNSVGGAASMVGQGVSVGMDAYKAYNSTPSTSSTATGNTTSANSKPSPETTGAATAAASSANGKGSSSSPGLMAWAGLALAFYSTMQAGKDRRQAEAEDIRKWEMNMAKLRTARTYRGAFASGGHITGAGTGTSDSIPILASNGEFMVNARSTKKHRAMLEMINRDELPKYARGGAIGVTEAFNSSQTTLNNAADNSSSTVNSGNSTTVHLSVTGDISRQTRQQIMEMLPEISAGVNKNNRERGFKYK